MLENTKVASKKRDDLIKKLERLYLCKCGQLEKTNQSSNYLRYQVLKAEAEVLKTELEHHC